MCLFAIYIVTYKFNRLSFSKLNKYYHMSQLTYLNISKKKNGYFKTRS